MKWILGTERLPAIGMSVYCRKSYYADKSGSGKIIMTIGKTNKKGELSVIERWPATWEWLDETPVTENDVNKKVTEIIYKNSHDCSEGLIINFENIQPVISLLVEIFNVQPH